MNSIRAVPKMRYFPIIEIFGAPHSMTVTRDLITHFLDAFNRHNLEEGMSFFAEDCVFLTHSGDEAYGSKIEGKQQVHTAFATALKGDARRPLATD